MKRLTIHIFDKNSSASMSNSVLISDKKTPANKKRIKKDIEDIYANSPFTKWFSEAESMDDLSSKEEGILKELDDELDLGLVTL